MPIFDEPNLEQAYLDASRNLMDRPTAGPVDAFLASWESMRQENLTTSEAMNLSRWRSKRRDAIQSLTGEDISGLEGQALSLLSLAPEARLQSGSDLVSRYQSKVSDLAARYPGQILTDPEIDQGIKEESARIREESGKTLSNTTFAGKVGSFAGAMAASLTDPLVIATLPFGAAKAAGILTAALENAGFGAMTEAMIQPFVYQYKKKLESPYSVEEAVGNVVAAGLGAGAIGGALKAAGKLVEHVRGKPRIEGLDDLLEAADKWQKEGKLKPTSLERDAGYVLGDYADTMRENPFTTGDPDIDTAHLKASVKAVGDLEAGAPVDVHDIVHNLPPRRDLAADLPSGNKLAFEMAASEKPFELGGSRGPSERPFEMGTPGTEPPARGIEGFPTADRAALDELKARASGFEPLPRVDLTPEQVAELRKPRTPYDTEEIIQRRIDQAGVPDTHTIQTPERQAYRADLTNALYGQGALQKNRHADLVVGYSGVGKTTVRSGPLAGEHGALTIDQELVKPYLHGYDDGRYAGAVHKEASDIADQLLSRGIAAGDNLVIEITGRNPAQAAQLVERLKGSGYTVNAHLVEAPLDVAAQRSAAREKFVDPTTFVNLKPRETFDSIKGKVDAYEIVDNNVPAGHPAHVVESGGRGGGQGSQGGGGNPEAGGGGGPGPEGSLSGERGGTAGGGGPRHEGSPAEGEAAPTPQPGRLERPTAESLTDPQFEPYRRDPEFLTSEIFEREKEAELNSRAQALLEKQDVQVSPDRFDRYNEGAQSMRSARELLAETAHDITAGDVLKKCIMGG